MIPEYDTFAEAYVDGLAALLSYGTPVEAVLDDSSVGSEFGTSFRPTRELRPFVFRVRNPAACLIACEPRQPDLAYVVGQWLWTMDGSDDVDRIAFYNPRGRMFSEDGSRLAGAFGARMRRGAGDQLQRAITLLRRDPGSRRAVVAIGEAADSRSSMLDHPCAIALHFMLRDGKLEVITTMRSQSALMVLPYDAALFMMIHVWVAAELGVECGPHTWTANSFHLYEDELQRAREVTVHGAEPGLLPRRVERPADRLEELLRLERRLREGGDRSRPERAPAGLDDPDEFHGALAAVLLANTMSRSGDADARARSVRLLPEPWRSLWRPRQQAVA